MKSILFEYHNITIDIILALYTEIEIEIFVLLAKSNIHYIEKFKSKFASFSMFNQSWYIKLLHNSTFDLMWQATCYMHSINKKKKTKWDRRLGILYIYFSWLMLFCQKLMQWPMACICHASPLPIITIAPWQ